MLNRAGSPPRAWRRCRSRKNSPAYLRFTSTCVETLAVLAAIRRAFSVHLHVRGDVCRASTRRSGTLGSPPRAWRRCVSRASRSGLTRFTSTCVETLRCLSGTARPAAVHLHVRGDVNLTRRTPASLYGSPPRAWRRFYSCGRASARCRFTSTCVETFDPTPALN